MFLTGAARVISSVILAASAAATGAAAADDSLRSRLPPRWWESAAGLKVVTLKQGRSYATEVLPLDPAKAGPQLDRIKAQGFQVIEIFAPAEGLFAYNGLDTKNHYRIDLELGTMNDFRKLIRLVHSKGIAVVVFHNVGYHSVEAPDWLEACDLKKAGKTKGKVKWFIWADRADAQAPAPEDTYFLVDHNVRGRALQRPTTWGWQFSERAGSYYWSRWEATLKDGSRIGLPADDWRSDEWPQEAARILRAWMDTGLDGMLIDAPLFYPGLNWQKVNRFITGVISKVPNVMIQPEGGRGVGWITDGGFNCIQDYSLANWDGETHRIQSFDQAIATGDPRPIEESLMYHDAVVAAGGVLYKKEFAAYDDPAKTHLAKATVAAIGDIVAFIRRRGPASPDPDDEETWILKTKFAHPALHNRGRRTKLETNADDKYYAFLRTSANNSERIVVVLNFQPSPQTVEVDLSGIAAERLVDVRTGDSHQRRSFVKIELPAYGYRFFQVIPEKQ
jgi:glycosidase